MTTKGDNMFYAFYFALHFVGAFLGLIIALHTDMTWIGLGIFFLMIIKFVLMLPSINKRTDI